ncbi:hypothetical protein [Lyngbya aestuarii]|uniref:hypothetical protein n=1 Tax=Lyngbya aestuarii TaxID=118322 RepID=UPI00403E178B
MSENLAKEQGKEIEQPADKEFELVEIQDNGSSKTFVYRDHNEEDKPEKLWRKLLGKNRKGQG